MFSSSGTLARWSLTETKFFCLLGFFYSILGIYIYELRHLESNSEGLSCLLVLGLTNASFGTYTATFLGSIPS